VTADHGEGLGEHGEAFHTYLVYEGTQHVPWILRGPEIPVGKVVESTVSNAAVAPTLAELAGLAALPHADVASAVSLWRADAEPGESWAYSESLAGHLEFGWAPLYAVRRGGEKFIDAPRDELYDLTSDPREQRNLLESTAPPRERAERAAQLLARARANERALRPRELDAETRAQVEALGYVAPTPGGAPRAGGEDPKDVHAWATLAQRVLAEFAQGDDAVAARLALETLERMPNAVRMHEVLAHIHARGGRPREALVHAREAARLNPFFADYHAMVASLELQRGEIAPAVRAFEEAARLRPDVALYRAGLVWKLLVGGSPEEAEQDARRAFELAPDDAALRDGAAAVFERAGELERALALYRETAERFPKDERTQMRLAIQYARLGDDARAGEHLGRAGASARDGELALRLAVAYAARGAPERAEPILRELIARDPSPAPRVLLARLYREAGREAEAQRLMRGLAPQPAPPAAGSEPR
jgi:tetratricopeptide (TPR) repeat protein